MRFIPPDKLTVLEKILIDALNNSCQPGCSHDGCGYKEKSFRLYEIGVKYSEKYKKK